jgi:hypothetical protein
VTGGIVVSLEKLPSLPVLIVLAVFCVDMVLQAIQIGMSVIDVLPAIGIEVLLMVPLVAILRLPR